MSVTLEQILSLSGPLDDTPGFDSARERFRRFLTEHAADPHGARGLIEQGQHLPGEQHHRALQDLVVLLGKFIGFEVTFGAYAPAPGSLKHHGHWKSRLRLHVILEVRSDPSVPPDVEAIVRAVAAHRTSSRGSSWRFAGLCVVTPLFASRHKIEEAIAAARLPFPLGVVALRSLLQLADFVSAGRVSHEDVARLLESNLPVDYSVELLERLTAKRTAGSPVSPARSVAASEGTSYWIATVAPDYATTPEQLLELVVSRRHIFGVADAGAAQSTARSGDWICFYIAGKGVVGRARVLSPASGASGASGVRDAHRFKQLLHLEDLELHLHAPVALDFETQLRLRTAAAGSNRQTQQLVRISHESFVTLTEAVQERKANA